MQVEFSYIRDKLIKREEEAQSKGLIPKLTTTSLIKFFNTLPGKNKTGNNRISQLQYFLNAFAQEEAIYNANSSQIAYGDKFHTVLVSGVDNITNNPDFIFIDSEGKKHTIEAKISSSESVYANTPFNFHNADIAIILVNKSEQTGFGRWYFADKADNYKKLYTKAELMEKYPWLAEFNIPRNPLKLIHINVNTKDTDDEIPEKVEYNFYYKTGATY